ncbi:MAG TPA: methyltransferase, partial [Prolixibacteraceae bacterium]|nr:methyltransferase [Prolixibacteraceae bacterium]
MAGNNHFHFKQFTIHQENAAMKVGTDGVLLGAWAGVENIRSVLDIGTGTGLIALMMAQRCEAEITAIEMDENGCRDAEMNIRNSPWEKRIVVLHTSFQEFLKTNTLKFDCVVCNPPFFSNSIKAKTENRTIARHNDQLPFETLIEGVSQILSNDGFFSVVLPVSAEREFRFLAANVRLFPARILRVKPKPSKPASRVLMEFRFEAASISEKELTIETETHHDYLP